MSEKHQQAPRVTVPLPVEVAAKIDATISAFKAKHGVTLTRVQAVDMVFTQYLEKISSSSSA